MLTAADRKLIEREPELPGLAAVLDEAALLDVLRSHPSIGELKSLTINYVRYKPNANCLVGCSVQRRDSTQPLYAVAYHQHAAADKLTSATRSLRKTAGQGVVDDDHLMTAFLFPSDQRLTQLADLHAPQKLAEFIGTKTASHQVLSYKPLRRCVTRIDWDSRPQATLRCLLPSQYAQAKKAAKYLPQLESLRRPDAINHSDRHCALVMPWMKGVPLSELEGPTSEDQLRRVGAALAELHQHSQPRMQTQTARELLHQLQEAASMASFLLPESAGRLQTITSSLTDFFSHSVKRYVILHGDFHADQVIVGREELAFLDWDRARNGDPESDLAGFLAHELVARFGAENGLVWDDVRQALLDGYSQRGDICRHRLNAHLALELVKASVLPFRRRHADWPSKMSAIVELAGTLSDDLSRTDVAAIPLPATAEIKVEGPSADELEDQREWLQPALNAATVKSALAEALPGASQLRVTRRQVLHLKPSRRALLQFDLVSDDGDRFCVLGKVKAKGTDLVSADVQARLYELVGAQPAASLRVARPLGAIPQLRMWLQEPILGVQASAALQPGTDPGISAGIATALADLHRLEVSVAREHKHADELTILRQRLTRVASSRKQIAADILLVLQQCEQLLARFPAVKSTGMHRDFYPAQAICRPDGKVGIVDFDLFAVGDPLIDVGNFLAHLKESAIRQHAAADALAAHEAAFTEGYLIAAPWAGKDAIQAHTIVSLARHIYISWAVEARQNATEAILCECLHLCHQMNQPFAIIT